MKKKGFLPGALLLASVIGTAAVPAGAASPSPPPTAAPAATEGCPLNVRSTEKDGLLLAEVDGLIGEPFARVSEALSHPASWCEFLPLVFNVKSCTLQNQSGRTDLNLYVGRKFFETPEESVKLNYRFQVQERGKDRLRVILSAPEGAFGTRDYRIELEMRPAGNGRTFMRMASSFRPSLRSKMATQAYLATSGRDKVGFSVEGKHEGSPVYTGGLKGILERNSMRYYLALQAFLDTLHLPQERRFEAQLHTWYDLTAKYPKQLYEMDKQTYLNAKRQERKYQLQLQRRLAHPGRGTSLTSSPSPS